jgi:hypothetical protein
MQNPAAMQLARRILRIGSDFCGSVTEGSALGRFSVGSWAAMRFRIGRYRICRYGAYR